MAKRYHITLGATTTVGGKVLSASSSMVIDGVRIALEDDAVWCPRCKSRGVIMPDGPRISQKFHGRQVALDGDLCRCRCNPSPRLVHNQTRMAQSMNASAAPADTPPAAADPPAPMQASQAGQTSQASQTIEASGASGTKNAVALRLLHPGSREPFKCRPYKLQLTGRTIEGVTDDDGFTQALTAAERASLMAWHIDE